MPNIKFVDAEEMTTAEDYATALICGVATLKTLELYHTTAFNKGLLSEAEAECGQSIVFNIRQVMKLYQKQLESLLEKSPLNEDEIVEHFRNIMPLIKVPRKRRKPRVKDDKII